MSSVVFLDTETTGLDPFTEDVFEVAIVTQDGGEHTFRLRPRRAVVERMHPKAAEVNRYHERTRSGGWLWDYAELALDRLKTVLTGVHICGAVPDFDTRHLTALYTRFGIEPPRWHYHLIDIEAMAVGYLHGRRSMSKAGIPDLSLPWKSDDLSRAVGVEPPADADRHTALGDARWVKRMYDAMTGGVS